MGQSRQPVLADEVQTFKALITIHKVLQEGHPVVVREAQQHVNWVDSLMRGVAGEGIRGTPPPSPALPPPALVWVADFWMFNRIWPPYSRIRLLPRIETGVPS